MNYLQLLAALGIGGAHPGGLSLTKKIFEQEQFPLEYMILDAGCGTGQSAAFLHQLGYRVTGLDVNKQMIEHAKARNRHSQLKISYYVEDLSKTSFPDHCFDLILSESVLQFTSLDSVLPEVSRILKNKGMLLAIEMIQKEILTDAEEKLLTKFYGCEKIYTIDDWKNLFLHYKMPVKKILTPDDILIDEDEPTTEFSPLEEVPQEAFDLLSQHEQITEQFAHKLSYCVFYACKA